MVSGIEQEYGRPYLSFMGNAPSPPTAFASCKATTYFGLAPSDEKVGSRSARVSNQSSMDYSLLAAERGHKSSYLELRCPLSGLLCWHEHTGRL